jgi:regulator of replication initiation timing
MSDQELLQTFIDYLKTDLTQLKKDFKDLKTCSTHLSEENEIMKSDIAALKKRLALSEGLNIRLQTKISQQDKELTDLKSRSMRDNIVIKGVPEDDNEKWEETKDKLLKVLKDKMKMPSVARVDIERAHRSGAKSNGKTRPIIAKLSPQTRDAIFGYVRNLKDHADIKIQEQIPPEVQEKRNRLWPNFQEAKSDRANQVKWIGDKLMINGRIISADDEKIEINPANDLNNDIEIFQSEHKTEDGSTVMGHAASISNPQDIPAVLAKLYQDRLIAAADHNMYAYRIGRTTNLKEGCNDDKEYGAGTALLKQLREDRRSNVIVIVTRWFGGKHIGPRRFELFKECAGEALSAISS